MPSEADPDSADPGRDALGPEGVFDVSWSRSVDWDRIVSYNLRLAREVRGLTQAQAAERMRPFIGSLWSQSTFSYAERGASLGVRMREFTAAEIVAMALAFDLPVSWFFLPREAEDLAIFWADQPGSAGRPAGATVDEWRPPSGSPEVAVSQRDAVLGSENADDTAYADRIVALGGSRSQEDRNDDPVVALAAHLRKTQAVLNATSRQLIDLAEEVLALARNKDTDGSR